MLMWISIKIAIIYKVSTATTINKINKNIAKAKKHKALLFQQILKIIIAFYFQQLNGKKTDVFEQIIIEKKNCWIIKL